MPTERHLIILGKNNETINRLQQMNTYATAIHDGEPWGERQAEADALLESCETLATSIHGDNATPLDNLAGEMEAFLEI